METAKGLHNKIESVLRMMGEIIYDDTHVLNISEEEDIDQFSIVHYRVYHAREYCFDVIREYDSSAERGAGGYVYNFLPQIWDGFEPIKPLSLSTAYKIIDDVMNRNKNGKAFDVADYRRRKRSAKPIIGNIHDKTPNNE